VSGLGLLTRESYSLRWPPTNWLRIAASLSKRRTPPNREFLGERVLITSDVRYYDPLRGETVDVTEIAGGIPVTMPQRSEIRRLGINVAPKTDINLRLFGEYNSVRDSNFLAALPPASAAVLAAFPERFVRKEAGLLTQVDIRVKKRAFDPVE
jgi:iron complex outermembrane recepter protein